MPHEKLQSLVRFVKESPSAIAMFDRDMRYLSVSARWKTDYRLQQDLIGVSHYEVFPEIGEYWKTVHRRALAGETLYSDAEAFRRQDGAEDWLQWVVWPWLDSDTHIGGVVISTFAISGPLTTDDGSPMLRRDPYAPHSRASSSPEQREIVRELRSANLILNHLPADLFDQLAGHLVPVPLGRDAVLIEPLRRVDHLYFPLEGLLTVIRHLDDGSAVEIAGGGRGGFAGSSVVSGQLVEETETRSLVRGVALTISADTLRTIMAKHPGIRAVLSKFSAMLMAQFGVSIACIARHTLDQRLAKWLMTAAQRMGDVDLDVSQEALALILGVRRSGVSEAMTRLTSAGAIETRRRHIRIRDREVLAARACECFHEAEAARQRSAPDVVVTPPIRTAHLKALVARFHALETEPR